TERSCQLRRGSLADNRGFGLGIPARDRVPGWLVCRSQARPELVQLLAEVQLGAGRACKFGERLRRQSALRAAHNLPGPGSEADDKVVVRLIMLKEVVVDSLGRCHGRSDASLACELADHVRCFHLLETA